MAGALGSLALEAGGGAKLLWVDTFVDSETCGWFPRWAFFFFRGYQVTVTGIFLVEEFFLSKMKIILNKVILKDGDSERW